MDEKKILGRNLKRHRLSKGLTQAELGIKVGLRGETISNIELAKQENIGLKYLILICRELNVTLEELFIKNPNSVSFKFIISDENVRVLEELLNRIKNITDKK